MKEDSLDAAMNEIVVTGQLADATGGDKAKAEELDGISEAGSRKE